MYKWFVLDCDGDDEAELNARLALYNLKIHRDEDSDTVCLIGINEIPPTYTEED